jgi:hypothetical protein
MLSEKAHSSSADTKSAADAFQKKHPEAFMGLFEVVMSN